MVLQKTPYRVWLASLDKIKRPETQVRERRKGIILHIYDTARVMSHGYNNRVELHHAPKDIVIKSSPYDTSALV